MTLTGQCEFFAVNNHSGCNTARRRAGQFSRWEVTLICFLNNKATQCLTVSQTRIILVRLGGDGGYK